MVFKFYKFRNECCAHIAREAFIRIEHAVISNILGVWTSASRLLHNEAFPLSEPQAGIIRHTIILGFILRWHTRWHTIGHKRIQGQCPVRIATKPERSSDVDVNISAPVANGKSFGDTSEGFGDTFGSVSYTHLRAHETRHDLVCRLLLEK